MIGITSIGTYIPMYRLQREEIARMWGTKGIGGEKAVAGYDEDSITMAVAAVRECQQRGTGNAEGLYFASTTAPYQEKQSAAIIASVVGLNQKCTTADFANSLKSGTTALKSALDAVKSESGKQVLVAASDCRMGMPKGPFEQLFGDAAAAVMIGSEGVISEIESCCSLCSDFTDVWRTAADRFAKSGEGRFIADEGYFPIMQEAVSDIMKTHSLNVNDISKIVFYKQVKIILSFLFITIDIISICYALGIIFFSFFSLSIMPLKDSVPRSLFSSHSHSSVIITSRHPLE